MTFHLRPAGSILRWLLLASLSWLLVACASGPKYPPAPTSASTADYNYIVGPGDNLNIIVWRNPELSMAVPVRPDGKVTTPLVDELVAQGKTSIEIAREVEKALAKFVRDPIVTVLVTTFVGPYSEQIRVVGEAAKPQALPYKQKMTLLDVMIAVGGLTSHAIQAKAVATALVGKALYEANINAAAALIASDIGGDVMGDMHASADYRLSIAPIYVARAITAAAART